MLVQEMLWFKSHWMSRRMTVISSYKNVETAFSKT